MSNCGQACPYNTLNGCKVKEFGKICPLTNTEIPITEYRPTHADRIRAMSDEELAEYIAGIIDDANSGIVIYSNRTEEWLEWLKQPAE